MSESQDQIAVPFTRAAEMLGMSRATLHRYLPDLKARGLKCWRGRYMVDTLRDAFKKMCDEQSGAVKHGSNRRQNGRADHA